ncbi:metallophosphoesterase [Rhodoferax sp. BAB1]|uniref:metallophosphoesterase family protein n=1 Tax=Rhodoferax sp. BAB1 TaxID=2741720 RepID=UPI0015752345|nr:metallophosphoesterase [Rhodoferax sp. BAB1]QKO20544.1 metallophosphoesterase [Rhodoferax sp. BAB1]
MTIEQKVAEFDQEKAEALRRIWFVGDVHGEFKYVAWSLMAAQVQPSWIVFAGDIDISHKPFRELLAPIKRWDPAIRVAFIPGNHDADSYEHWEMLHDSGDAISIHGQVMEMEGIRVAGLGGHFVGRVWMPPSEPLFRSREEALRGGTYRYRDGQRPSPTYLSAIYAAEVGRLSQRRADILITHEAPSCHPHGHTELDMLARSLQAQRMFHGHHHDDRTAAYALQREQLGFDAIGLRVCAIKNGLGEVVFEGEKNW